MIRAVRALAWVRWRALVHSLRGRVRGDGLQRLGAIAGTLVPLIYALMLAPLCLGLALGGLAGGWAMARDGAPVGVVILAVRVLLGLVFLGVLLAPLVRSTQGLQMGVERLLLLPISRRLLHLAEVVGGVTDPWVAAVIPALALLPVGMLLAGALGAAALAAASGLLLVIALGALGSLCTSGLMLVFRDRRRAEWVTLVFIVVLVLISFVPAYIEGREASVAKSTQGAHESTGDSPPPDFEPYISWAAGLPSELYASSIGLAVSGRPGASGLRIAALGVLAALFFALSDSLHRRLMSSPERASGRRTNEPARAGSWKLPGAGPAASAVALSLVRTALRTVRGKIAVYFVVVVVLVIAMVFGRQLLADLPQSLADEVGPLLLLLGMLMTLLSLQPILMNQFAVDGAGLTLEFLTPASDRELVRGKILGCGILGGISMLLCAAGAALVSPEGSPWAWLAMILTCVSSFVVLAPASSLTSIFLPKRSNLNRLGKAGDPHGFAGLIGVALIGLTLLPPLGLYAAAIFWLDSPAHALLLVSVWTVVALGISLALVRLAAIAVSRRRETLYLVASEGGP